MDVFGYYVEPEYLVGGTVALILIVYLLGRAYTSRRVKARTSLNTFRTFRDETNTRFTDTAGTTRIQNGMIATLQDQVAAIREDVTALQRADRAITRLNREQQEAIRSLTSETDRERIKSEALEQWIAAKEAQRRGEEVNLDTLRDDLNARFEAVNIRTNIERLADVRLRNLLRDSAERAQKDNENEIVLAQLEELRQRVEGQGLTIESGAVEPRIVESGPIQARPVQKAGHPDPAIAQWLD